MAPDAVEHAPANAPSVALRALVTIVDSAAHADDAQTLLDDVVRSVEHTGRVASVTASLDGSDTEQPPKAPDAAHHLAADIVSDNQSIGRIEVVPCAEDDTAELEALIVAAGQVVGAGVERLGLKAEAERLRAAVDNVVLRATHDLRGPVSALGVATSSLVDRRDVLTLEQQHRLLELIGKSVEDLRDAIAQLPATARAEEARGGGGWTHL